MIHSLPADLSSCAMRDERGQENKPDVFQNYPPTKPEYLSRTKPRCFMVKATAPSLFPHPTQRYPGKIPLAYNRLVSYIRRVFIFSKLQHRFCWKKKKTWQNKSCIFEPYQKQNGQPNLNLNQSDQ